jgi:transcriptional regulator with XRE-family HTH domain
MRSMLEARLALKISQIELSKMLGINQALLSLIESGKRLPTPNQRLKLTRALGEIEFHLRGETMLTNVPNILTPKWKADGKPDFTALESDKFGSIQEQLSLLLRDDYNHIVNAQDGDFVQLHRVDPNTVIYELNTDGKSEFFKRSYGIVDGQAMLEEDGERISPEQFSLVSRRRVPQSGVPAMPTTEEE